MLPLLFALELGPGHAQLRAQTIVLVIQPVERFASRIERQRDDILLTVLLAAVSIAISPFVGDIPSDGTRTTGVSPTRA